MDEPRAESVQSGLYMDYERHFLAKRQWLARESRATGWTVFMGILLTVALARSFRIYQRVQAHIQSTQNRIIASSTTSSSPNNSTSNLQQISQHGSPSQAASSNLQSSMALNSINAVSTTTPRPFHSLSIAKEQKTLEAQGWHHVLEALHRMFAGPPQLPGAGVHNANARARKNPLMKDYWHDLWHRLEIRSNFPQLLGGLLYLSGYLGVFVCSVFTAGLATNHTALSASPNCGLYLVHRSADRETAFRLAGPYNFDVQVDSAAYARDCYSDAPGPDACRFFTHRSIKYHVGHNVPCPFRVDMCPGQPNSSISLDTGAVDSKVIGINAPHTYEFRRHSVCSPLNMNTTYIRHHKTDDGLVYYYNYGVSETLVDGKEDWSYQTRATEYMPDGPGYLMGGLFAASGPFKHNSWTPIEAITPAAGSTISIIFITSQKVYYQNRRDDLIFPADKLHHVHGLQSKYYINSLGHATVMACVDRTEWRDPEYGPEWSSMSELPALPPKDPRTFAGMWLMRYSLLNSNMMQSIDMRLGNALEAQSRTSNFVSMDMPENQWELELEQFFKISLARIQINARNIACGVLAKYDGWYKASNNDTICMNNYLFQAPGWTNINFVVSLLIFVPCAITVILAIPGREEELWPEPVLRYIRETSFGRATRDASSAVTSRLGSGLSSLSRTVFCRNTWTSIGRRLKFVAALILTLPGAVRHTVTVGKGLEEFS